MPSTDSRPDNFSNALPTDEFHPEGERLPGGGYLLSPAKVRNFLNAMSRWEIEDEDVRRLLGDMSRRAHSVLKEGGAQILGRDAGHRISHLLDFSDMLDTLYGRRTASERREDKDAPGRREDTSGQPTTFRFPRKRRGIGEVGM